MRATAPADRSATLRQFFMARRCFRGGGETGATRPRSPRLATRTMKMVSAPAYKPGKLALQLGDEERAHLLRELGRDVAQHAPLVDGDVARGTLVGAEDVVVEDHAPVPALLGRQVAQVEDREQQAIERGVVLAGRAHPALPPVVDER